MSLATQLRDVGAFKTGEFELASGQTSNYYIDMRLASSEPTLLRALALQARGYTVGHDAVAGTALGGVPLATAVSLETGLPLLMVRSEAKEHGTGARVEGRLEQGMRVLLVEDVVTTAGSLVDAATALRDAGAHVTHAVCAVDRQQGGREACTDNGIKLHALVTLDELMDTMEAHQ